MLSYGRQQVTTCAFFSKMRRIFFRSEFLALSGWSRGEQLSIEAGERFLPDGMPSDSMVMVVVIGCQRLPSVSIRCGRSLGSLHTMPVRTEIKRAVNVHRPSRDPRRDKEHDRIFIEFQKHPKQIGILKK
jgi:hypothetical protein